MPKKDGISLSVIKRLPRYYRFLGMLLQDGTTRISSKELAQRMQAMVRAGRLQQVTYPSPEDPIYHCRLRKTPGVWNK